MPKYHLLRNYSLKSDSDLADFALNVSTKLTGNAALTSPPTSGAALKAQAIAFNALIAACQNGTKSDTLNKDIARAALIATLDALASYVEMEAQNDPTVLTSSGFILANPNRPASVPPGNTSILSVTNLASGKFGLELLVAKNAWCYVVECSAQPGGPTLTMIFTDPHNAVFTGLTPGTMYQIRAKVMGSGNQETEWCEAVTHMAT
jgi:hypothetical protein